MTANERKAIRDEALIAYHDAVDDRKAHCEKLYRIIDILREVVRHHDDGKLGVSEDRKLAGHQLPTHDDLVTAFIECQKAKQREERAYAQAVSSGVDPSRLSAPGATERPSGTVTIASALA